MKVKIKSFNGELPSYLTEGKVYEVDRISEVTGLFWLYSDDGKLDCFIFDYCLHLNGGSWEVVD